MKNPHLLKRSMSTLSSLPGSWKGVVAMGLCAALVGCGEGAMEAPLDENGVVRQENHTGLVANGDFEQGPACGCGPTTTFVSLNPGDTGLLNWTILGNGVTHVGSGWTAANGIGSVELNDSDGPGGITQTLSTVSGAGYTLSFRAAGDPTCGTGTRQVKVSYPGHWFIISINVTSSTTTTNMGWGLTTATFTATSSSTPLTFESLTSGSCGPVIDMVTVTAN
jgi:choice-of-anchor C domain-containing protein